MKPWMKLLSAFAGGAVVGGVAVRVLLEKKVREEYDEKAEALERVFNLTYNIWPEDREKEGPAETEEELDIPIDFNEVVHLVEPILIDKAPVSNNYHKALSAVETDVDLFVDGGVNDYGISYIEEEEYLEDDGRFKGKIDIMMEDHNPIFLMDGEEIDDWDRRVGDSILVDFYKLVPPGIEPVLYVRNHRSDEDYEVVRVVP